LTALAIAWFGLGVGPDAVEQLVLGQWAAGAAIACPIAGFLSWRRFVALETTATMSASLRWPRWARREKRRGDVRRHSPLRALIEKELHLQHLAFVVAGLYLVIWTLLSLAQRHIPSWSTFPLGAVMLMYCVALAIVIGALGSAEERQHGTFDAQSLQPVRALEQWAVKVAVATSLSLAFAVGLPMAADGVASLKGFQTGPNVLDLIWLVVVLTSSSFYVSSLCGRGVRALTLCVPIGLAAAMFIEIVNGVLSRVAPQLVDAMMAAQQPTPLVLLAVRGSALALVTCLLWLGYQNHISADRSPQRIAQQAGVIALVAAGGVLLVRIALTAATFH
jgi:hypothetical protein